MPSLDPLAAGSRVTGAGSGDRMRTFLKSLLGPNLGVSTGTEGTSYFVQVGVIVQGIESLISFFDWLFGGPDNPPLPRQLRHGRHPLYPDILGVSDSLVPTEESAGKPQFCGDPQPCGTPPLQKAPSACSQYDAECAASKGADTYACGAGNCCRDYGSSSAANCVRGCLLAADKSCSAGGPDAFTRYGAIDACREGAHVGCFYQCGNPGIPPYSCWSTLGKSGYNDFQSLP